MTEILTRERIDDLRRTASHGTARASAERAVEELADGALELLKFVDLYADLPNKARRYRDRGLFTEEDYSKAMALLLISDRPIPPEEMAAISAHVKQLIADGVIKVHDQQARTDG